MTIRNRHFVYEDSIEVSSHDFNLAQSGRKQATVRLGTLNVGTEMIFLTDGNRRLPVQILSVDNSRMYGELTDEDAFMDGLESLQELDEDLRQYYGRIDPRQPMTIIYFRAA